MKVPVEVEVPEINITMPMNMPLMCDVDKAVELFGIGKTTLAALRKNHPDFPCRTIGRSVWYLVPDLYAWLRDYPGGRIPTE